MSGSQKSARAADRRPLIYGILDLCFVLLYLLLATVVAPTRHTGGSVLQWMLVVVMAAAAGGMFFRGVRAWWLAVISCGLLLVLELVLLCLILVSASYLAGVYGSIGEAASAVALVVAALSIELVALLPALQLKYLLSRAGRRAFGAP